MKRITILCCVFYLSILCCYSQHRGNYWVFGDSVGINFNTIPPTVDTNVIMYSIAMSASIADNNGNLLFYCASPDASANFWCFHARIYDRNYQTMQNGDTINAGVVNSEGATIIPFPDDSMQYYVFHIAVPQGNIEYSVVNMNYNGGLGKVTPKNHLLSPDTLTRKMKAVKHGNGRDWWLLLHKWRSHEFVKYLIDPSGIHGPYYQSIGTDYNIYNGPFDGGGGKDK